jgi:hypothetical protein
MLITTQDIFELSLRFDTSASIATKPCGSVANLQTRLIKITTFALSANK